MSANAIAVTSESVASSAARAGHAFAFKAGASVTSTEARAERSKSAICFGSSIGLIASAAPAASPPQIVKWVSGRLGKTNAAGRSVATRRRSEKVCRARHVGDEFGVGPNVRVVEAVGRAEERQRGRIWSPFRACDERGIGALRKVPLNERNGFDRGDVG